MRILIASNAGAGHVHPVLALARELRGRGHQVTLYTDERWRETAARLGLAFAPGNPPDVLLGSIEDGETGRILSEAADSEAAIVRAFAPDVVVNDTIAVSTALAAEALGVARVTLVPHPYPAVEPGMPLFMWGMVPPRTSVGGAAWRALASISVPALRRATASINAARTALGLDAVHGVEWGRAINGMTLVATYPQLEYPRRWPADVHVTGPMIFDPDHETPAPPSGGDPLIVVGSSTALDPTPFLRIVLDALGDEPVRLFATLGGWRGGWQDDLPENATLVDWVDYRTVAPAASLVICPGGHGTVTRALAEGAAVLVSPATGEQAVTGARIAWARVGAMLPRRLFAARSVRWAVRGLLRDQDVARRTRALAEWTREHDGAARGAELIEELASD
jgi:MGT family glycosyltransferase